MNPYALPSFCAFPLLLVIGLAVVLQNPRNKSNRLLFLILIVLALQAFASGMLHYSDSEAEANFWNKWPYILAIPSFILLMEYILLNSGGNQRLKEKLLRIEMGIHRRIIYFFVIFYWVIVITTDQVVAPAKYYSTTGWEHQYGPLFLSMMIFACYMLTYHLVLILRGIKSASNSIDRNFRISILIAFCIQQIFLFSLGLIIPWLFDIQTHSIGAFGWIPMCFVLAYGLMRSQWETIQDLNINLDKKVQERTLQISIEKEKLDIAIRHLNSELDEAAKYVISMLPRPMNDGPIRTDWRFIPSASLGGDSFGYHRIGDENFAVYLIDVSGHGVGAALLSISVINVLRSQSLPKTNFKDPAQVLRSLNFAFPSESNKDMFFTMWYGVYNQHSRELTYSSGGHPPAILFNGNHGGDSTAALLKTPNYVIGGMPGATYKTGKCDVGEHSSLYIFSDGVYEVEKQDGSMWRFQEFTDYMQQIRTDGHEVLDRLYGHVKDLGNSEILEDDFTILEVFFN